MKKSEGPGGEREQERGPGWLPSFGLNVSVGRGE